MTRYPIYIISKGRAKLQLTVRELTRMGADFKVCVEPQEFDEYAEQIGSERLVRLPFSNLGQGSIPARNWVWEDSIASGFARHWILDDNIEGFNRLNKNRKYPVKTDAIFRAAEDFTDRYENIGLSGMNYYSFCKTTDAVPAFYTNTRIYSCILVNNSLPLRWRGKYNEDTDLSLRVLKLGMVTVLFNAFLCGKITSMRMKGGNTDNVYNDGTNRRAFAESLAEQHPDCAKVVWRFNRWHHHVDYRKFKKNKLVLRQGIHVGSGINEYGMQLVDTTELTTDGNGRVVRGRLEELPELSPEPQVLEAL